MKKVTRHRGPSQASLRAFPEVDLIVKGGKLSVDHLLVELPGISEPLPVAEPRLGRRTVLTFPLLPPPQKN